MTRGKIEDGNNKFRGYEIKESNGAYIFVDTGESVSETWRNRPCGKCGQHNTPEGHDACLGTILGPVINACCGHGDDSCAYIQFNDGTSIRGNAVFKHLLRLRGIMTKGIEADHWGEVRELLRAEVKRIATKIVKQAVAEMISSGVLFQNSTATRHPKYQPQPKRPVK